MIQRKFLLSFLPLLSNWLQGHRRFQQPHSELVPTLTISNSSLSVRRLSHPLLLQENPCSQTVPSIQQNPILSLALRTPTLELHEWPCHSFWKQKLLETHGMFFPLFQYFFQNGMRAMGTTLFFLNDNLFNCSLKNTGLERVYGIVY